MIKILIIHRVGRVGKFFGARCCFNRGHEKTRGVRRCAQCRQTFCVPEGKYSKDDLMLTFQKEIQSREFP